MATFTTYASTARLGEDNFLVKLGRLIDWEKIRRQLKGLHKNEEFSDGGPKAYDVVKMFKAILLAQWHNLSDPGLEESLKIRLDFIVFTGFDLFEKIPDDTTFCRFRNKLIESGLHEKLLREINAQLEEKNIKIKEAEGAIIDATVVESSCRPRRTIEVIPEDRREENLSMDYQIKESEDPDARWLKKGNKNYFGYKAFVASDDGDGFIEKVHVTPANVSEMNQFETVIQDIESKRIYADKGYASRKNREKLREKKNKDGIMHKMSRGKPLTFWQQTKNRLISKKRFLIEQIFGTLKRKFGCGRASYRTRDKVQGQFYLKAICFNLLKAMNKIKLIERIA